MGASDSIPGITDLVVTEWVGTDAPAAVGELLGRVTVVEVFQLLCPGCVAHGIPQAERIRAAFPAEEVTVLGLHSVFEHHAAMGSQVLRAFLAEYAVPFPVAIDAPSEDADPRPVTMRRFAMRGTPTLLLFDAEGRLAEQLFGAADDVVLGARIARLVEGSRRSATAPAPPSVDRCDEAGCAAG